MPKMDTHTHPVSIASLQDCNLKGLVVLFMWSLFYDDTWFFYDTIAWLGPVIFPLQSSCVSLFATKLKHLLDNVTVPKENETILQQLEANLQYLVPHPQVSQQCVIWSMILSSYCLPCDRCISSGIQMRYNPEPSLCFSSRMITNAQRCRATQVRPAESLFNHTLISSGRWPPQRKDEDYGLPFHVGLLQLLRIRVILIECIW